MTQSDTLTVTDPARVAAHRLLAGADTWLPVPASYKALTAALLPPRLRDAFALPYGGAERRAAQHLIGWVRRIYPLLPSRLRYVGPYQEAERRLVGKAPDFATRMCNRFWIGQADLPRGDEADQVLRQDYEPVGLVSAAPMSGDWFHQHFGVSKEGLRITAWHGPNNQRSRKPGRPGEQLMDYGAIDLKKGGSAIPYHEEDRSIRQEFEETLRREGVTSRMDDRFYQPSSDEASEPAQLM
jgi:hypothetical protein